MAQMSTVKLPPSDSKEWPPPLDTILRTARHWMESYLTVEPGGQFQLSVGAFFFDEDGDPGHAIMVENSGGDKRDEFLDFVRLSLVSMNAQAYFLASETWAVERASDEDMKIRPTDSPRRKEKIMAMAVNNDKKIAMCRAILRDADGKVSGFGEVEEMGDEIGGRMARLLPKRPWPQGAQEMARLMLNIKHKPHTREIEIPWNRDEEDEVQ